MLAKRVLVGLLSFAMTAMLAGCGRGTSDLSATDIAGSDAVQEINQQTIDSFADMSDPELLRYVEDTVYSNLVTDLDSDRYFVENVEAVYISQEYIDELAYNSQENIYFGYSLSELDRQFQGKRYIFTTDDSGQTTVEEYEAYDEAHDDACDQVVKNVAVGTGVILVCVTVSAVSGGMAFPAVSMVFATAAKTGTVAALSGGVIGGVSAGVVTGIQTNDMDQALKSVVLGASEGYKWGAIAGALSGGASEAVALKGATLNGLSMNEAAAIQRESGYPLDVIKQFKSVDQYNICRDAGLEPQMVNGRIALVRQIDMSYKDPATGKTNLELMRNGNAPIDPSSGKPYELHHIGQQNDSTLAVLTKAEHMQNGNNSIWHEFGQESAIDRSDFSAIRKNFWKTYAKLVEAGGIPE